MAVRLRRSALFLPASNPRAIAKARTLACDVVILDLEDAVAPDQKDAARAAAVAAVCEGGFGDREIVVRVNALASEWGEADCAALRATSPDAVLVPKVDDGRAVAAYRERIGDAPIWAMVETAKALLRLEHLAAAPGLAALVLGPNDLAAELRVRPGPDRLPLLGFLASSVAAARAYGLTILDGVYNAIDDPAGFAAECEQGARFGCDGKTLIHPSQIDRCNEVFRPTHAEIASARAIVAAFAAPGAKGKGVIRVDGAMVERLHLAQAERTLALAASAAGGGAKIIP